MNKRSLRIALAQLNLTVGDLAGNTRKIIASAQIARDQHHADVVIFPEMALVGYPAEDLLLSQELITQVEDRLIEITAAVRDIYLVVGFPRQVAGERFNAAGLIYNGAVIDYYAKQQLPNYGVFDERRYFVPGQASSVVEIKGVPVALAICEDLWELSPVAAARAAGAELILALNASPFEIHKAMKRNQIVAERAQDNQVAICYTNLVGGQDELVFDGGSFVVNNRGEVIAQAPYFIEDLLIAEVTFDNPTGKQSERGGVNQDSNDLAAQIYQALVMGVRDYFAKNHLQRALIGISGGIDSALTAAIAVDALGPAQVELVYLPSDYSSELSRTIAQESAERLGVKFSEISIKEMVRSCWSALAQSIVATQRPLVEANIQARCRGMVLMALANQHNALVLSTSNKSEAAVGYTTLYGDMVGGLSVLQDLLKSRVYQLADYRNQISPVIPQRALERAPTAELIPNQLDSDDLPPYPLLDQILEGYLELNQSPAQLIQKGLPAPVVQDVVRRVDSSEYKRRQMPPGIKITPRAFGKDWRYPLTRQFKHAE